MISKLMGGADREVDVLGALGELSEVKQIHWLVSLVREQTAAILGRLDPSLADPALIEPDKGFADLGFDSMMAIELRDRVQTLTGVKLPATVTFDHPTARHLAALVREALAPMLGGQLPRVAAEEPQRAAVPGDESIAIVGLALRIPGGVCDLDGLWRFLEAGRSAVGPIPASRWNAEAAYDPNPDANNSSYVRDAAMLDHVDRFDAEFFGISPREAKHIDPQHRLLLEAAWEAIEGSGILPSSLKDSSTGVFVGIGPSEYASLRGGSGDAEAHAVMGTSPSFAAGRLAFSLGLQGPALSVDTACSSSLVALHLACQALRQRECNLALAAGVQVMASPEAFALLSRTRALAPDGHSKTFSANADGYGRGEGVVVLALERLSDARARQHRILALVRGSAVNHDGASSGITAPNGTSQQKVLRAALRDAGLTPLEVDVVECHGTGTSLGDPIEVQALAAVYGAGRPTDRPLLLGALKTNIGHLESAAGLAGVAKVVASLRHDALPPTLNTKPPNPHIDWDGLAVDVVGESRSWPPHQDGTPRRAGVSAFGLSGTNAHVIIEDSPDARRAAPAEGDGDAPRMTLPMLLAGKTERALRDQAARLRDHLLAHPKLALGDVAYSLALTRSQFLHRAVIVVNERAELLASLEALAEGLPNPRTVAGRTTREASLAFVFPGQGSQWKGMALSLLESSAVFREQIEACELALAPYVGWSLSAVLRGDEGDACFNRVDVVQPTLFAIMFALAAVWRSVGVEPTSVVGHSQGEIVAACVAGALSLGDAAKVVALRSRALTLLAGKGAMAAVELGCDALLPYLARLGERLGIAAINSPNATLVSGDPDAVDTLLQELAGAAIFAKKVRVDFASHSAQVEPVLDELLTQLAGIVPRRANLALYSTVTASRLVGTELDAEYWCRNLRQTVRFWDAAKLLIDDGHCFFVEVSPHPVLTLALQATLEAAGREPNVVGTLRRDEGGETRFLLSLGELHTRGFAVDWTRVLPRARGIALPTYPFQHERFWLETAVVQRADVAAAGLTTVDHPLLGAAVALADNDGLLFTSRLSLAEHPWLASHVVFDSVLVPGATFVELALLAAHRVDLDSLDELIMEAPLVLPADGAVLMQLAVGTPDEAGRRTLTFYARPEDGFQEPWQRLASGVIGPLAAESPFDLRSWPPSGAVSVPVDGLYERLASIGLAYGAEFQGLRACWKRGEELFAEVQLPESIAKSAADFGLHPALLDAALHALMLGDDQESGTAISLPFSWSGVSLRTIGASLLRVRLNRDASGTVSLLLADASGEPLASVEALTVRTTSRAQARAGAPTLHDALFRVDWLELASVRSSPSQIGSLALVGAGAAELDVALALRGSIANLARYPHLAALRDALDAGAPAPDVVLVAFNARTTNAGAEHIAAAAAEVSCEALALLQSWLADERLASARLVLLSERAIATRPDEDVPGLVQAPLWGIVRSAQSENTGHSVLCVDIDATDASRRALPAALSAAEPQLALREGRRLVPRLARVPALAASTGRARSLDPDGTVLITGGTGTLGGLVASHLVHEHGIKHLLLASRQGDAAPGVEVLTRELEAAGASVTVARCDSADRRALEQLFAAVPSGRPLTAVVHAAGILDDGMLGSLTPERLRLVLRSKVDAALHLHELTKSLDLSAFVLFSSLAGVLGSPGQASYAAANSFLDALAHHRRAQALPAIALDWSLWAQKSAMTGHLVDADLRRMARGGLRPLASVEGLALFDAALARQESALVIAHFDLAALRARAGSLHPIFSGLVQVRAPRPVAVNVADATSFKQRLLAQPAAERERALVDLVRTQVAAVLGVSSPAVVELDRPLQELGLDSIMAVEIRNRLTMATGLRLPATLLFNYPTASALALCLQSKLTDLPRTDSKSTLSDYEIHAAIASVSLDRLREAGLLDRLLALALSRTDLAPVDAKDAVSEIASMSVDDLVRIALENPQNG